MKRKGLLTGILLLILMLLCSCGASEEAKEIDAQLQEQQAGLAQAEAAYLEADGTIAPEHAQEAVQAVAEYAAGALERGEIAGYTQEENGVLLRLESGVTMVYLPKVQGMLAGGGEMEILTLEPYHSDASFALTGLFGDSVSLKSRVESMLLEPQIKFGDTKYTYRKGLTDEKVTVSALKKLPDHACIFLLGHGGYLRATGPLISSGEAYSLDTLSGYLEDFIGMRLYVGSDGNLMVGAAFFETYYEAGDLEDDLIYLACCSGLEGEELAETLLKKGADTVVGATDSIPIWYEKMMLGNVTEALGMGRDISQAIAYGENDSANLLEHGLLFNQQVSDLLSGARMEIRGNAAYSLVQSDFSYDALAARSEPYSHASILDTTLQAEAREGDYAYCLSGDQAVLLEYTGKEEELTVPAEIGGYEVLAIGQKCFAGNTRLKKVVIPNTIRAIHPYAFYECSALTQLTIGYGVKSIGFYALEGTSVMEISVYEDSDAAAWCEAKGWPDVYKSLIYLPRQVIVSTDVLYEHSGNYTISIGFPHIFIPTEPEVAEIINHSAEFQALRTDLEAETQWTRAQPDQNKLSFYIRYAYAGHNTVNLRFQYGQYIDSFGHDISNSYGYTFSLTDGSRLSLPDLLNEENSEAELQLKALMAQAIRAVDPPSGFRLLVSAETAVDWLWKDPDTYGYWFFSEEGLCVVYDDYRITTEIGSSAWAIKTVIPYQDLQGICKEIYCQISPASFTPSGRLYLQEKSQAESSSAANIYGEASPSSFAVTADGQVLHATVESQGQIRLYLNAMTADDLIWLESTERDSRLTCAFRGRLTAADEADVWQIDYAHADGHFTEDEVQRATSF